MRLHLSIDAVFLPTFSSAPRMTTTIRACLINSIAERQRPRLMGGKEVLIFRCCRPGLTGPVHFQESERWSRKIIMPLGHWNRINVGFFFTARVCICLGYMLNSHSVHHKYQYTQRVMTTAGFKKLSSCNVKRKTTFHFLILNECHWL